MLERQQEDIDKVHTGTGKENFMTFPWLLIQFQDLKIDNRTSEKNERNAPLAERFEAWHKVSKFLYF